MQIRVWRIGEMTDTEKLE